MNKEFIIDNNDVYEIKSSSKFLVSREDFIKLAKDFSEKLKETKKEYDFDKMFVYGIVNGITRNEIHYAKKVGTIFSILKNKINDK